MLLREWSIGNFKSFADMTNVKLAPLTLIAGANSSGKSSFLQSMLLLKQTVQYGAPSRTLALNTPLLRFGTLREVLSENATSPDLLVGFSFNLDPPPKTTRLGSWTRALRRHVNYSDSVTLSEISGYLTWQVQEDSLLPPSPNTASIPAAALRGSLRVVGTQSSGQSTELGVTYEQLASSDGDGSFPDNFTRASVDARTNEEVTGGLPDGNVTGTHLYHFMPNWFSYEFNAQKKEARDVARALCRQSSLLSSDRGLQEQLVSPRVIAVANEVLERHQRPLLEVEGTGAKQIQSALAPIFQRYPSYFARQLSARADESERAQIEEKFVEVILEETLPFVGRDIGQPRTIGAASDFIREFFRFGVRYLGPLRDQPRAFYEWEDSQSTSDVGFRGEHTAAVLRELGGRIIDYIPSECFSHAADDIFERKATLNDAVADWLNYLGIATDVRAWEHGLQGDALVVRTEGLDRDQFLTNVGVGVSQILPIVVSALIAERTSLLIFEQPELHLQPKVQARLADFFFSICLAHKQCVLETHSEHLINRIRRRIAESDDDVLLDSVAVYFTERVDGRTNMRSVQLNAFGAVVDWPRDFFDQSEVETEHILLAAARKAQKNRTQE